MFWIYNILLTALSPIWVPVMLLKSRKRAEQPNWKERTGNIERKFQNDRTKIWVHAVSVGEVIAAGPFLKELKKQDPTCQVLLSVTTSSGHQTASKSHLSSGLIDQLSYFPIDVVRFQLSGLTRVRPHAVAIMETELWLNFLWAAHQMGIKTLLVNGRISERSFARSKNVRGYYRSIFKYLDFALMQTKADAERAVTLGAQNPEVLGNTKFDDVSAPSKEFVSEWFVRLKMEPKAFPVLVVGSARGQDEHDLVISALKLVLNQLPDLRIIYAPRHIEGADLLAEQIQKELGSVAMRSKGESGPIILLDTYGELAQTYGISDLAIIGGGFDNLGGQNLLQPMEAGVPVIRGSNFQNFQWIVDEAGEEEGVFVANSAAEISTKVLNLLSAESKRKELGQKARKFVKSHQGASAIYAKRVLKEAKILQAEHAKGKKKS